MALIAVFSQAPTFIFRAFGESLSSGPCAECVEWPVALLSRMEIPRIIEYGLSEFWNYQSGCIFPMPTVFSFAVAFVSVTELF